GCVRPAGNRRTATAPVVIRDDAEPLRERRHLRGPALLGVGEAVDEHQRLVAVAVDAVVDLEVGDADRRHGCTAYSSYRRNVNSRAPGTRGSPARVSRCMPTANAPGPADSNATSS